MNNFETFYDEVKITGEDTAYVSIPKRVREYMGLKKGDTVKIMIQKKEE